MLTEPIVSVVIPTKNRPTLVTRAVLSALAQTLNRIKVLVVIDGMDAQTFTALSLIVDPRARIIALPHSVGGSEARNVGVRHSSGKYIALLDDDDEWKPDKLSRQLELAQRSTARFPVVTCRLIARRPISDEIWPARLMKPSESMSDYLLCRESSIRQGEGFIQTSTLLVPRDLMLQTPFIPALPRHQDWDWLIRASVQSGVEFVWVWEPLVIYHINAARKSVSSERSLAASINWVNDNHLIGSKAKAYFYATQIAARCKTPAVLWSVLCNTIRYPRALLIAMVLSLTPRTLVYTFRQRSTAKHA